MPAFALQTFAREILQEGEQVSAFHMGRCSGQVTPGDLGLAGLPWSSPETAAPSNPSSDKGV